MSLPGSAIQGNRSGGKDERQRSQGVFHTHLTILQDGQEVSWREEMINKCNQLGVPCILIGDDDPIVGFNEALLKERLGL